jgi:Uma2 family endonuclease
MSSAEKYTPHYTVEDYQLWEGDWELWGGTAVAMTPSPFGGHGSLLGQIVTALNIAVDAAQCQASVIVEVDWIVAIDTVLRPDVTIVCGEPPDRHVESPPALVVEILSASTRQRDLTFKKQIYQEQVVPWYLIIDPEQKTLEAFRLNADGEYQSVSHDETLDVDICNHCSLAVKVGGLFR